MASKMITKFEVFVQTDEQGNSDIPITYVSRGSIITNFLCYIQHVDLILCIQVH